MHFLKKLNLLYSKGRLILKLLPKTAFGLKILISAFYLKERKQIVTGLINNNFKNNFDQTYNCNFNHTQKLTPVHTHLNVTV